MQNYATAAPVFQAPEDRTCVATGAITDRWAEVGADTEYAGYSTAAMPLLGSFPTAAVHPSEGSWSNENRNTDFACQRLSRGSLEDVVEVGWTHRRSTADDVETSWRRVSRASHHSTESGFVRWPVPFSNAHFAPGGAFEHEAERFAGAFAAGSPEVAGQGAGGALTVATRRYTDEPVFSSVYSPYQPSETNTDYTQHVTSHNSIHDGWQVRPATSVDGERLVSRAAQREVAGRQQSPFHIDRPAPASTGGDLLEVAAGFLHPSEVAYQQVLPPGHTRFRIVMR